jgi:hypothetical protein
MSHQLLSGFQIGDVLKDSNRPVAGRGQQLVDPDPARVVQQESVGEGAANVGTADHHSATGPAAAWPARPMNSR